MTHQYLEELKDWMHKWRLALAQNKCKCMFFRRREPSTNRTFPIRIDGTDIKSVKVICFLSLKIDCKLRFGEQVDLETLKQEKNKSMN